MKEDGGKGGWWEGPEYRDGRKRKGRAVFAGLSRNLTTGKRRERRSGLRLSTAIHGMSPGGRCGTGCGGPISARRETRDDARPMRTRFRNPVSTPCKPHLQRGRSGLGSPYMPRLPPLALGGRAARARPRPCGGPGGRRTSREALGRRGPLPSRAPGAIAPAPAAPRSLTADAPRPVRVRIASSPTASGDPRPADDLGLDRCSPTSRSTSRSTWPSAACCAYTAPRLASSATGRSRCTTSPSRAPADGRRRQADGQPTTTSAPADASPSTSRPGPRHPPAALAPAREPGPGADRPVRRRRRRAGRRC